MGAREPSIEELLDRMGRELSAQLFPFFVISIVHGRGSATKDELDAALAALGGGRLDFSSRSLAHLVGRLEKTYGLLARAEGSAGRYVLTDKGKALYEATLRQIISPLQGITALIDSSARGPHPWGPASSGPSGSW